MTDDKEPSEKVQFDATKFFGRDCAEPLCAFRASARSHASLVVSLAEHSKHAHNQTLFRLQEKLA